MFDDFPESEIRRENKQKSIILMQNGNPSNLFKLEFSKNLNKEDLMRGAQKKWGGISYKSMRIYSIDAVEYFDEDLLYLKNGDRLYISRGEQFDSYNNFGEFQIIRKLGEGGFGSVELAKNIITGQFAAIKILKTERSSSSTDIDMIFKEAENLKALNHPHIVKIISCYAMSDMRVVIVMEYLEGGELLSLLQEKGKFDEDEARFYFKQIMQAVAYCHRQGIIHRDLKLENILIKNKKMIKVADFGISGVADRFNPEADWGTIKYMSPQVLHGKHKLNSKGVDVWACGVILYHMVIGKLPFNGSNSTQIIQKIAKTPVEFPPHCSISNRCRNLIKKMLNKNPEERVQMSDIQTDSWIINQEEKVTPVLKTTVSQEFRIHLIESKKEHRKTVNIPKPNFVKIPKRLEKEKDRLQEELRDYHMQKKVTRNSNSKIFPPLRRGEKYSFSKRLDKISVLKQTNMQEKKGDKLILRK